MKVVYVAQSICCFCLRYTLNVIYFLSLLINKTEDNATDEHSGINSFKYQDA